MSQSKMSPEDLQAESLRLSGLIQQASKAGSQAVQEMSKRPLSSAQVRQQIRNHTGWAPEKNSKPDKIDA